VHRYVEARSLDTFQRFYVSKYIDHHEHEYAFSLINMNMITQVQIAPESGGATEEYLMTISSQNTYIALTTKTSR